MQMINDDNWVLSVGTFLPMLGVIVLLVTPKANEAAILKADTDACVLWAVTNMSTTRSDLGFDFFERLHFAIVKKIPRRTSCPRPTSSVRTKKFTIRTL